MFLLAIALGSALAADPRNTQVVVHVAVVHALKQDHPWGVRLGGEWQFALADHCEYGETACYRGEIWPVAGPALKLTWRGGERFAAEFDGEVGVGGLEMADLGFLPRWEVMGRVGLRYEFAPHEASLVLGGFGSKSFGVTVHTGETTLRRYGTHAVGARFDADTAWVFGDSWRPPVLAGGAWVFAGHYVSGGALARQP